jgi:hypothetical protein
MDGFGDDYDVLPIPTTAFDSYMPQLDPLGRFCADPVASNVHDLENLLSPVESEPMHQSYLAEEPMSASDGEEEEESFDFGPAFAAGLQGEEVFAVDLSEERELGMSPDTPTRPRQRLLSEKRFSPFPTHSPARAKLKSVPKLSASLPAPPIAMPMSSVAPLAADNKRCACCDCSK